MGDQTSSAIDLLRQAGIELDAGLGEQELRAVERAFGFRFAPDHAALLRAALPVGQRWVDWRRESYDELQRRLDWPIDSFVWDVHNNAFWPASWGTRPEADDEAEDVARRRLSEWPRLVPVYGHRYLSAAPAPSGAPVFSVWQTDVIYYGSDLVDYLRRELKLDPTPWSQIRMRMRHRIPYWSHFVDSANRAEAN